MTETILNFENFKLPFLLEGNATKTFTQNSTHIRVVNFNWMRQLFLNLLI